MRYTTIYNDPKKRRNITESCVYWDNAFTDEDIDEMCYYFSQHEIQQATVMSKDNPLNMPFLYLEV